MYNDLIFMQPTVAAWGKACPAADGEEQSPVDIVGAVKADMPPLSFDFKSEDQVDLSNVGWTMVVGCSKGSGKWSGERERIR